MIRRLLEAAAWAFAFVPPRLLELLAGALAWLAYHVLRVRRGVMDANVATAFPEATAAERARMAKGGVQSFLQTMFEFFSSERYFREARMEIVDRHVLDGALAKGRGAYIMCIHIGNWEFLCSRGTREFAPVSVLAKDVGRGEGARWVTERRRRNGCYVIPRNGEVPAALQIPKVLARNEIIGFIVDQHKPGGPRVPLFGKPAHTNSGLFQLWMRHKAPVIPAIARRVDAHTHQMIFFPEFEVEQPAGMKFKETVLHNVARMNAVVEEMIRRNPDQYFWLHRRWK